MSYERSYVEASVPVGAALIAVGVATWAAQYLIGVFTAWIWAVPMGGLWVLAGALLLFPDMRLYQYDRSPLEQLLTDAARDE